MEEKMPIVDSIEDEEPIAALRPGCAAAKWQATRRNSPGAPRRIGTTLLDLVSRLSDDLQDDERAVRLVTQWIREGRVRTSAGLKVQLSMEQASGDASGHFD